MQRKPQINVARTRAMKSKSDHQLIDFIKARTLSSAAALYQLQVRYPENWMMKLA